jgi:hypothetical protein
MASFRRKGRSKSEILNMRSKQRPDAASIANQLEQLLLSGEGHEIDAMMADVLHGLAQRAPVDDILGRLPRPLSDEELAAFRYLHSQHPRSVLVKHIFGAVGGSKNSLRSRTMPALVDLGIVQHVRGVGYFLPRS